MTEPVTPNQPSTSTFTHLSAFLAGCQSNELLHIFDEYEQGLLTVLECVPVDGQTFTVSVMGLNGKVSERTVPEEVIRDTPEARQWRDERAETSRLAIMASTGEISTTMETLTNNPEEFDKLVASRRAFLKNNKGKAKSTAVPPRKPSKAGAPAAAAPKPKSKNSGSETPSKVTQKPAPTEASEE